MKFVIFLLACGLAVFILKYTEPLVRMIGKNAWAEQYLGGGGTYTMWKLIALGIVIVALFYWIPPGFLR